MTGRDTTAGPAQLDRLLLLIGRLNYAWTNTESVLIHLIAGIGGMTKETAVIVFLSLNTTRARVDLVERLAKADGKNPVERDEVLVATGRFMKLAGTRNRYNHCIYSFDPDGAPRTILMRVADRKHDLKIGRVDVVDDREIARIEENIAKISDLNIEFWRIARKYDYPI